MAKSNKTVFMYASDFSLYGKLQAMKSTLRYLSQDAGHRFIFVNDPQRGDVAKIKFGKNVVTSKDMKPTEMSAHLAAM